MRINPAFIITLFLSFFIYRVGPTAAETNKSTKDGEKIKIELFVMSQCPFGVAAEKALLPLIKKYGDRLAFSLYFIAQNEEMKKEVEKSGAKPTGGGGCSGDPSQGKGPFYSLHGQPEVDEDIRQAIMAKYFPAKYLDYILCRAENYKDEKENAWEKCAVDAGIDLKRVKELAAGKETADIFDANIQKAWGLGIGSSPTILINGKRYAGNVETNSLMRAICKVAPDIQECKTLPACSNDDECFVPGKEGVCVDPNKPTARCQYAEPARFSITILSSKSCTNCNVKGFMDVTTHYFPSVTYKQVDIGTPEGKKLAEKYSPEFLPAMLFSKEISKSIRWDRVKSALVDKGDVYLMHPKASGSKFPVSKAK